MDVGGDVGDGLGVGGDDPVLVARILSVLPELDVHVCEEYCFDFFFVCLQFFHVRDLEGFLTEAAGALVLHYA